MEESQETEGEEAPPPSPQRLARHPSRVKDTKGSEISSPSKLRARKSRRRKDNKATKTKKDNVREGWRKDVEFYFLVLLGAALVLLLLSGWFIWAKWDSLFTLVVEEAYDGVPFLEQQLPSEIQRSLVWMGPILSGGGKCAKCTNQIYHIFC